MPRGEFETTNRRLLTERDEAVSAMNAFEMAANEATAKLDSLSEALSRAEASDARATKAEEQCEVARLESRRASAKEAEMKDGLRRETELRHFADEAISTLRREVREIEADTRRRVKAEMADRLQQAEGQAGAAERERQRLAATLADKRLAEQEAERRSVTRRLAEASAGRLDMGMDAITALEPDLGFLLASAASSDGGGKLESSGNGAGAERVTGSKGTSARQRMLSKLKQKSGEAGRENCTVDTGKKFVLTQSPPKQPLQPAQLSANVDAVNAMEINGDQV